MCSELFIKLYHHRRRFYDLSKNVNHCRGLRTFRIYHIATISNFLNIPNFDASILHRSYCLKPNHKHIKFNTSAVLSKKFKITPGKDDKISSVDYVFRYSIFKDRCLHRIVTALDCSHEEALNYFKNYPFLFRENIDSTSRKIDFLKNADVPVTSIVKNIEILELSESEIIYKINEFDTWGLNGPQKGEVLLIMNLEQDFLNKIFTLYRKEKSDIPRGNRLIYFSEILNCSIEKLVNDFLKHTSLFVRDFEKLNKLFQVLLDAGISTQAIQNNIWLGLYNAEKIQSHLQVLSTKQDLNDMSCKNFLLKFQKIVEKGKSEKLMLQGHKTRAELLSEKLNVSVEIIEYLMSKHSLIFDNDLADMIRTIEYLLSIGYTGKQICAYPKVLNRGTFCLQKRIIELKCYGENKPPIAILSDCNAKYQKYLQFVIEVDAN